MKLVEYINTPDFNSRVCNMFPVATSTPLHKCANIRNPGVELDIQQAIYNISTATYAHRKEAHLIQSGLNSLKDL